GIILLFVLLAVPAIRALSGQRSIAGAQNELSAMIVRAREEAIGLQDYRGIMFYVDPGTDRVVGALVRTVGVRKANYAYSSMNHYATVWLDLVPDRDSLMLPVGIRLQTITGNFDQTGTSSGGPPPPTATDRYIGYNIPPNTPITVPVGGVILFDGNGRLVSKSYGLACYDEASNITGMGSLLGCTAPTNGADIFVIGTGNPLATPPVAFPMTSCFGVVLFDNSAFTAAGFADTDPSYSGSAYSLTGPEGLEEAWIDANATPVFINRYNGTLIKSE
ncbi:MAG TPA: hypothetical protein VFC78_10465, partial [Tepidisphaeraceae bacterium]|nr:hypothetical protein [Tepidisphaeraceae bacterium]